MVVKFENVSCIYDKHTVMAKEAVNNVSFEIKEGDCVAVLGKTGSGKSTLLSLITGIEKSSSGTIEVNAGVSMLFQAPESQLFAQTVIEDVMYGPLNIGLNEKDAKDAAVGALKLAGIDESLYDKNPAKLSGGQKRKVALAGILAMNRPLLLLDSPTVGLDNKSSAEIMNTIQNLNKKGVTVVFTTNESEIARQYAKRVLIMEEGVLLYDGNPTGIYKYGFEAPAISVITKLLYKKGLTKLEDCFSAQTLYNSLEKQKYY